MKKIIIIVITAMLILSGCNTNSQPAATQTPPAAPTATPIATSAPTATPDANAAQEATNTPIPEATVQPMETPDDSMFSFPHTLVDKSNVTIILEDVLDYDNQTVELLFSIVNDTGSDYNFFINSISINNVMMPFYAEYKTILAGHDGLYAFNYSKYTMREYGIDTVADIQFNYSVINTSKSTTEYQGTFHLQGSEDFLEIDASQDNTLIAANEYIDVYLASAYKDNYNDEYYQIVVKNKNDITLNLNMTGIAINGISVPSSLSYIMLPNSTLIHNGYVSGAESSFLTDIGSVKKIEVEFTGSDKITGTNAFTLMSGYVFDETIDLSPKDYEGMVIYSIDNMTIGVQKIYEDDNVCNEFELYILNTKDSSAYITITDIVFNGRSIESDYSIAVLPNTYARQIITPDDYIGDEQHEMSIKYEIRYSYTAAPQEMGLSFVLQ